MPGTEWMVNYIWKRLMAKSQEVMKPKDEVHSKRLSKIKLKGINNEVGCVCVC